MLIDQLPEITTANDADEIPIEQGTTTRKIKFVNLLKNVLKLTGGTITGNLTIQKTSPGVALKITNLEDGVAPATTTNQLGVRFRDKNDANVAIFADHWNQNGQQGLWISGYRLGVANGLYLVVDSDGNRVVRVSEVAPWRYALGLGTNGALPITIAQGGTGQTEVTSITTISQVATAASGFTITSVNYAQWGKLAMLLINIKKTDAQASAADLTVCTIASGKRPAFGAAAVCANAATSYCYIGSNGALHAFGTWSAGTQKSIFATYILP